MLSNKRSLDECYINLVWKPLCNNIAVRQRFTNLSSARHFKISKFPLVQICSHEFFFILCMDEKSLWIRRTCFYKWDSGCILKEYIYLSMRKTTCERDIRVYTICRSYRAKVLDWVLNQVEKELILMTLTEHSMKNINC